MIKELPTRLWMPHHRKPCLHHAERINDIWCDKYVLNGDFHGRIMHVRTEFWRDWMAVMSMNEQLDIFRDGTQL